MPPKAVYISYIHKQGFEVLQMQWMALIIPCHTSFQAESGPQIRYFGYFLSIKPDGYVTV